MMSIVYDTRNCETQRGYGDYPIKSLVLLTIPTPSGILPVLIDFNRSNLKIFSTYLKIIYVTTQAIFESLRSQIVDFPPALRIWLPCWKRRNFCGVDDKPTA